MSHELLARYATDDGLARLSPARWTFFEAPGRRSAYVLQVFRVWPHVGICWVDDMAQTVRGRVELAITVDPGRGAAVTLRPRVDGTPCHATTLFDGAAQARAVGVLEAAAWLLDLRGAPPAAAPPEVRRGASALAALGLRVGESDAVGCDWLEAQGGYLLAAGRASHGWLVRTRGAGCARPPGVPDVTEGLGRERARLRLAGPLRVLAPPNAAR